MKIILSLEVPDRERSAIASLAAGKAVKRLATRKEVTALALDAFEAVLASVRADAERLPKAGSPGPMYKESPQGSLALFEATGPASPQVSARFDGAGRPGAQRRKIEIYLGLGYTEDSRHANGVVTLVKPVQVGGHGLGRRAYARIHVLPDGESRVGRSRFEARSDESGASDKGTEEASSHD